MPASRSAVTDGRLRLPRRHGSLVHIESGKRVYQLYAELDQVDPLDTSPSDGLLTLGAYMSEIPATDSFRGPWGFETMGNAGGQTVVGAFSTGPHGGDFDRRPIADSVVAIHLVADGGKHYWIESSASGISRSSRTTTASWSSMDPTRTVARDNFKIVREDDNALFNAVLVSAGRFGVIYSVVHARAAPVRMYERRRLHVWQDFKHQIKDRRARSTGTPLYSPAASYRRPPWRGGSASSWWPSA